MALLLVTGSGAVSSAVPTVDVTGSWYIYYYDETQSEDSMVLKQEGNVLSGTWSGEDTPTPVDITGSIDGVTICIDVPLPNVSCRIDASMSPENKMKMKGKWIVDSGPFMGIHPWRAEKKIVPDPTETDGKTKAQKPEPEHLQ